MTTLALLVALGVTAWIIAALLVAGANEARDAIERITKAWEERRKNR